MNSKYISKSYLFKKAPYIDKYLTKLIKKIRAKSQINNTGVEIQSDQIIH